MNLCVNFFFTISISASFFASMIKLVLDGFDGVEKLGNIAPIFPGNRDDGDAFPRFLLQPREFLLLLSLLKIHLVGYHYLGHTTKARLILIQLIPEVFELCVRLVFPHIYHVHEYRAPLSMPEECK